MKVKDSEFLLAGSPFGILQITKDGKIKNIESENFSTEEKKNPSILKRSSSLVSIIIFFILDWRWAVF